MVEVNKMPQDPYMASLVALSCNGKKGRYSVSQIFNTHNSRFWSEVTDISMDTDHTIIFFSQSAYEGLHKKFIELLKRPIIVVTKGETYFVIYGKTMTLRDFVQDHILARAGNREVICIHDDALYNKLADVYEGINLNGILTSKDADRLGDSIYTVVTQYLEAKEKVVNQDAE